MSPRFPPQVHVFVRDWLSANNILLTGRDGAVFVDTGYIRHAPLTLALLRSPRGIGDGPLAKIVNTHCHSDHMGGNATLARAYGCPVAVPQGEALLIEAWDEKALLFAYADQQAERFTVDQVLIAGSTYRWGDLDWEAIAAPGHAMGALCFFNRAHGILISGDALWQHGFGLVMPQEFDPLALPATRATLEMLARLPVEIVIPGHGEPFAAVGEALDRAFRRLEGYEADPMRLVRHVLKALLAFKLLDVRRLPLDGMASYLDGVGLFRDFNARYFRLPPAELAAWLVDEMVRVKAARLEAGMLVPATPGADR